MKLFIYLKKNWYRIVSIFCIGTIVLLSGATIAVAAMSYDDILDSLGFGDFSMYIDDSDTLVHQIILNQLNMSDDEYTAYYFEVYYDFLLDDHWGLATGAGGMFDSTNNFNDAYLTSMGQQYEMFNTVTPFKWSVFVEYAKARRAYELSESGSFDSDSFVKEKDVAPIQISSKGLKNVYADYASRYMPMPNVEQYVYNYQSAPNKTGIEYGGYYSFGPLCPAYTPSKQWGNKSWSEVYILIFLKDDDLSDVYYSNSYYHLYSDKSSEGVSQLKLEEYNLFDNTIAWTESKDWDNFQYILFSPEIKYGEMLYLYNASDFENYSRSLQPPPQGVTLSTPISRRNPKMGFISGSVINSSSQNITSVLKSSTFTPNTNVNDDWGFILSSKPFELMMNQQNIDFDRIPDNYVITINGDTIYDYSVTNPDTGQTSTVNNYVNNNYTLPNKEPSGGDGSGGSSGGSGTVSGNVTVGGKVDVSGKIDISTNPIDINVNVNNSGSGSSGGSGSGDSSGVEFDQDLSLNNYYGWLQQQSTGFSGFMKQFLSWLPEDIVIMICAGLALVILARFIGR